MIWSWLPDSAVHPWYYRSGLMCPVTKLLYAQKRVREVYGERAGWSSIR